MNEILCINFHENCFYFYPNKNVLLDENDKLTYKFEIVTILWFIPF